MAITVRFNEESFGAVEVVFKDEKNNLVTPNSATWTLSDLKGTIINSRENVNITGLSHTIDILLSGDDLVITDATGIDRVFTVKAVINSDLGNNLPVNEETTFSIKNLVNVS